MRNSAASHVKLVAVDKKHNIIKIPNRLMRKPGTIEWQEQKLSPNSVCITCNYIFKTQPFQWSKYIKAICHPFKDSVLPTDIKTYLLSESDFCDHLVSETNQKNNVGGYDFAYFTINSLQGILCKGLYTLLNIDKAARLANLKGLVVNYGPALIKYDETKKNSPEWVLGKIRKGIKRLTNLTVINRNMSDQEVCDVMKSVKFMLFPNTCDASPRLLAESLIRNTPALVNKNIYGGWKYINEYTGMFFNSPPMSSLFNNSVCGINDVFAEDLSQKMVQMTKFDKTRVKSEFYSKYGFKNSSQKLANIINEISGTDYKFVAYDEWRNLLSRII